MNPGSEETNIFQFVDWRFSQLMNGFQLHTSSMNKLLEDKFRGQEEHFRRLTTELAEVKKDVRKKC